ncbi:hypothetical protein M5C99_04930 [Acidovorax sp. NCPPB 2350]|nr:hypothetical protein M5C99_04930 [Acidovorax sp. NCPPB 2350]
MKPIETRYQGFRFRSRAEARWAVFLDALQIPWTYEIEGFNLDGTRYLPDFWVKGWNLWIEVKGPAPTADEIEKCHLLALSSGKRVLLLSGEPWIQGDRPLYDIMMFSHPEDARHMTSGWEFGEGRRNADEIWLLSDEFGAWALNPIHHERDEGYPLCGDHAGNVCEALSAARGARFEHSVAGGA